MRAKSQQRPAHHNPVGKRRKRAANPRQNAAQFGLRQRNLRPYILRLRTLRLRCRRVCIRRRRYRRRRSGRRCLRRRRRYWRRHSGRRRLVLCCSGLRCICRGRRNIPSSAAVAAESISGRIFAAAPRANEHVAQFALRLRTLRLRCRRAHIRRRSGWRRYMRRRIGCKRGLLLYSTGLRRIYHGRRNANLNPTISAKAISRRIFATAPPASECAPQLSAAVAAELCARMRAAPAYGTGYWACCH